MTITNRPDLKRLNTFALLNVDDAQLWKKDAQDVKDDPARGEAARLASVYRSSNGTGDQVAPTSETLASIQASHPGLRQRHDAAKVPSSGRKDRRGTLKRRASRSRERSIANPLEGECRVFRRLSRADKKHADISIRKRYILTLAKALLQFGSPSHRIPTQLSIASTALELDVDFYQVVGCIFVSFGDNDTHTTESHFIKATPKLSLTNLPRCVSIFKDVVHEDIDAAEGTERLVALMKEPPIWSLWWRALFAGCRTALMCMMGFKGSILDACICFIYGAFTGLMASRAKTGSQYSNVFEVSTAVIFSFVSRALSTTRYFCYQSLTSGGLVCLLPSIIVLSGALELASKNYLNGSVKLVYAVIYSLFLGFGIVTGSDFFTLLSSAARARVTDIASANKASTVISAAFIPAFDGDPLINGTFTFDATLATGNNPLASISKGKVMCLRDPTWPWWRQAALQSPLLLMLFVPLYAVASSLSNGQKFRDWQLPVQVLISVCGYFTNYFANKYMFASSDVVSSVGAFVVATLGNIYARITHRPAYTSMAGGVMFLLPGSLAVAGGLSASYGGQHSAGPDLTGIALAMKMIQIAIGITVGLYASAFLTNAVAGGGSGAFTF